MNWKALKHALIGSSPFWFLTAFVFTRVVIEGRIEWIPETLLCATFGTFWFSAYYLFAEPW